MYFRDVLYYDFALGKIGWDFYIFLINLIYAEIAIILTCCANNPANFLLPLY